MDKNFYSDAVQHFEAMANSASKEPVDAAHFKMWCRVAARELNTLRSSYRIMAMRYQPDLTHDEITNFMLNLGQNKKDASNEAE